MSWYRDTKPRVFCADAECDWSITGDEWWTTTRELRDAAKNHARRNPGHRVVVDVVDHAVYRVDPSTDTEES